MKTINHSFRRKLNQILGGFSHNYCYQCGACVPDCPTHKYLPDFNPRTIILKSLLGFETELIREDSLIWNCTNCYNCHERCPQEVSPIEVIIALKNMTMQQNKNPEVLESIVNRVKKTGSTVTFTTLSQKRRRELNLPETELKNPDEVQKLLTEKN